MSMYRVTNFIYKAFEKIRDKYYIRRFLTLPKADHWLLEYKDHDDKIRYITLNQVNQIPSIEYLRNTMLYHHKTGKGKFIRRDLYSFECPLCKERDYYPSLCSCCEVSYMRYVDTPEEAIFEDHYNYMKDIRDRQEHYMSIVIFAIYMDKYTIYYD